MPNPSHANHLIHETSPYLRQHAHNPVDWHPWNAEALARAAREDRPILLSIGYSACHWCHVMERESFEDPETAALMNALFVNIKVDREERPDLDRIYQLAHQILTQRGGGWPLTVFLTPHGHMPFFAGTYFPPEPRHGLPAFRDLLNLIARYYREQGDDIRAQNGELREVLASLMPDPGQTALNETPLLAWQQALPRWSDREEGGFGSGAKFPHTPALRLLLQRLPDIADPAEQAAATDFLRQSLDAMALRGLWDHVGEGFFRYTVDPAWRIPHFEKMLYDNALLLELYSEAWSILADPLYRERALGTARWAIRQMHAPQGGFYASLDADSGGEEGAYYVWSREAVRASLPEKLWAPCCAAWGLDEGPNFEGRHWHLQLQAPIPALAHRLRIPPEQLQAQLHAARDLLREAREHRPPVMRDEKVLTAWNGLMIKALAVAARRLAAPELGEVAGKALDAVRRDAWQNGRLRAVQTAGQAHLPAYLDDHAFLLDAALAVCETCGQPQNLRWAIDLADTLLAHFEDQERGGFYFTAHDHEPLIHRLKPFADEATPAGNAVAARALNRLGRIIAEPRYLQAAADTLRAGVAQLRQAPYAHAELALALQEFLHPPVVVVLRGTPEAVWDWHLQLQTGCSPSVVILPVPDPLDDWPAALASKPAHGLICAYVCQGSQCEAPYTDLATLKRRLAERSA